jgi:hypothetical protein
MLRDWTDSLRFDGITAEAERLFMRLIMKADDYGRFHAEPRLLKAGCFPLQDHIRPNDLFRWLDELSHRQLILRYEVSGRAYLAIVNFGQRLKQSRQKFPTPPGESDDFLPMSDSFREVPGSSGKFPSESETYSETYSDAIVATTPTAKLVWSSQQGWNGITDEMRSAWLAAYPACNIQRQLAAMEQWLRANPAKAHKSNWLKFITNWLARAQDKGGDVGKRQPANTSLRLGHEVPIWDPMKDPPLCTP